MARKRGGRGLARRVRGLERELRRRDHELARYRADVMAGVLLLLQEHAPLDSGDAGVHAYYDPLLGRHQGWPGPHYWLPGPPRPENTSGGTGGGG